MAASWGLGVSLLVGKAVDLSLVEVFFAAEGCWGFIPSTGFAFSAAFNSFSAFDNSLRTFSNSALTPFKSD